MPLFRTLCLFLALILLQPIHRVGCEPDKGWYDRLEASKLISQGEVERNHQLKLEAAKIEVLARLEKIKSVSIYNNAYSSSGVVNTQKQETNVK
jgi:hypothetical protein